MSDKVEATSSDTPLDLSAKDNDATDVSKLPTVIIVIGMAGSGKTRFVHRLITHLVSAKKRTYSVNLDPAVGMVPYPCNIDIRDTVNYKEVMKHFQKNILFPFMSACSEQHCSLSYKSFSAIDGGATDIRKSYIKF